MQDLVHSSGKRAQSVQTIGISAPLEKVFPLLCPEREKEWLDGWAYNMIFSDTGFAEDGCVFTTGPQGKNTVWVVSVYDPDAGRIEFTRFHIDLAVDRLALRVYSTTNTSSEIEVSYTVTSLSEGSNDYAEQLCKTHEQKWRFVGKALDHFVRTDEILPAP